MKTKRQMKILEMVREEVIETQEQLAERLRDEGINVTQATVSRDIKELNLIKTASGDGRYRYALPPDATAASHRERLKRFFHGSLLGVEHNGNLVVLKTLPGAAQGVGVAIDNWGIPEIIGTVAGDDTVLVVVKPVDAVEQVAEKLRKLMTMV
ncbi:MAG: arginine repressor [Bacillota bacterium]